MDHPVHHPCDETHRVLGYGDGCLSDRRLHPCPQGRQDKSGRIIEDGIISNDQLSIGNEQLTMINTNHG
jgi:hypothetical protein